LFRTVELQNTFYNLPDLNYALRLREEAPELFIFNMKAWQVITHPRTSPTWRKLRVKPPGELDNYGYLRPTRENLEAWSRVVEFAETLGARVVVLQTPPSFKYSEENVKNINNFFVKAKRGKFTIGWEPRGDWNNKTSILSEIICKNNLIHVVDPLRIKPILCYRQDIVYFRLHGLGKGEVNYKYKYSDADLEKLTLIIKEIIENNTGIQEVYVMFNNVYMGEDAQRFRKIASELGLTVY
jgi:uncharacterized protein YecE (DUF72 family)